MLSLGRGFPNLISFDKDISSNFNVCRLVFSIFKLLSLYEIFEIDSVMI